MDGTDAVLLFMKAFSTHGDPNKKEAIDCSCLTQIEDLSVVILEQLRRVVNVYKEGTDEYIRKAITVELPALDQVMIDFSQTECGSEIFSE